MPKNVLFPWRPPASPSERVPLGLAGVSLDPPYGLLHLNWAGAGTFALAIYPPLFRSLVGRAAGWLALAAGCDERWSLHWALLRQLGDAPWGRLSDANC